MKKYRNIAIQGSPKSGLCPTLLKWLKWFFIVHSTVDSTAHMFLNSSKHCVCTTMVTNIRLGRDSNSLGPTSEFRTTAGPNMNKTDLFFIEIPGYFYKKNMWVLFISRWMWIQLADRRVCDTVELWGCMLVGPGEQKVVSAVYTLRAQSALSRSTRSMWIYCVCVNKLLGETRYWSNAGLLLAHRR